MSNSRVDISGGYTAEHIKAGFEKKPPEFVAKPQNPRFTSPVWQNFDCIHQVGSDIALPHWYKCKICYFVTNCDINAGNAKLTRHLASHAAPPTYTVTAQQLFSALSSASSLGQKYGALNAAVFELHCSKAKDALSSNVFIDIENELNKKRKSMAVREEPPAKKTCKQPLTKTSVTTEKNDKKRTNLVKSESPPAKKQCTSSCDDIAHLFLDLDVAPTDVSSIEDDMNFAADSTNIPEDQEDKKSKD